MIPTCHMWLWPYLHYKTLIPPSRLGLKNYQIAIFTNFSKLAQAGFWCLLKTATQKKRGIYINCWLLFIEHSTLIFYFFLSTCMLYPIGQNLFCGQRMVQSYQILIEWSWVVENSTFFSWTRRTMAHIDVKPRIPLAKAAQSMSSLYMVSSLVNITWDRRKTTEKC